MKLVLKAIAKYAGINLHEAVRTKRYNPLFEEEAQIEEELIRLEELVYNYHLAAETLRTYPKLRRHILRERRDILKHCVGLIARMMIGLNLPRSYTQEDTKDALKRLVRIVVADAKLGEQYIDDAVIKRLGPLMSFRQRWQFGLLTYNPIKLLRMRRVQA